MIGIITTVTGAVLKACVPALFNEMQTLPDPVFHLVHSCMNVPAAVRHMACFTS